MFKEQVTEDGTKVVGWAESPTADASPPVRRGKARLEFTTEATLDEIVVGLKRLGLRLASITGRKVYSRVWTQPTLNEQGATVHETLLDRSVRGRYTVTCWAPA